MRFPSIWLLQTENGADDIGNALACSPEEALRLISTPGKQFKLSPENMGKFCLKRKPFGSFDVLEVFNVKIQG